VNPSGVAFDCSGFAQVTWKPLSIASFTFSVIRHVSCDVHEAGHHGISSGFGNNRTAVAVSDKDTASIL
jgi:hypothetical protein